MRTFIFSVLAFLTTTHFGFSQRIVTAGSSSSEIVCTLGFCDKIIATDRTSLYPENLQQLPSIGYRGSIAAEGIISLQPDLIILEKEYVKEDVITQLKSTNIKTLSLAHEQNFGSTKSRIREIAMALSAQSKGEALIREIEQQLEAVERQVSANPLKPRVLCVYARGAGSMQVAGKNTSFGLLPLAGTINAVDEIDGYKPLNVEALIQANPDYILFFTSGLESVGGLEGALKIPGVMQTTAGKKKQLIHVDGILLTNWGPRVAQAAEQLFHLTHPVNQH